MSEVEVQTVPAEMLREVRLDEQDRIIKLLDEHVLQLEVKHRILGFTWKQRCRCGFYGVFNEHLTALINGENK